MIRFQDVDVSYTPGKPILSNINLKIDPDSFHFLTGTSGAGKSSLLKIAIIITPPLDYLVLVPVIHRTHLQLVVRLPHQRTY